MGVIFSSNTKKKSSSIDSLSDEEVYALIDVAIKLPQNALGLGVEEHGPFFQPSAWRISSDAIVKRQHSSRPSEAYISDLVLSKTTIRTPKVRRVLPHRGGRYWWIVMDYVEGETLRAQWLKMGWLSRLYVVWTMRRYIRELHMVPLPMPDTPGPFDETGQALICKGFYSTEDHAGPFQSYKEMADWYDKMRHTYQAYYHERLGEQRRFPKFDLSHPFVLCHNDLYMGNIIVDKEGNAWLIDWGSAGAFPPWFEYAHLASWGNAAAPTNRSPKSWQVFSRFIAGDFRWHLEEYLDKLIPFVNAHPGLEYEDDYFQKIGLNPDLF